MYFFLHLRNFLFFTSSTQRISSISFFLGFPFFLSSFSPWSQVPLNSYELNFVLSDGEGAFENNQGQDFTFPVEAGITWDDWVDTAADRAAAAAAKVGRSWWF